MKLEPRPAIHMEKLLLTAVSSVGHSLRDLHGKAHSVSQVNGVSDMAPACQLCGSAHLSVWENLSPSSCLDASHLSFSLYATGAFQAATSLLELRGNESE